MKKVMKDIFLNMQYLEEVHESHNDLPFLPERIKIEKIEKLLLIYMKKLNILFT